jgi:hypothetical protein
MLDAIALENLDGPIVAMDRARHGDGTLGQQQAGSFAFRDADVVGDGVELGPRHLENGTGIDTHDAFLTVG